MHAPLGSRISSGDDHPPVWQHILSELAVKDELVTTGLRHLRGRGQLIEEENAFPGGGKELGRYPFGLVCLDPRQSPQIYWIKLYGTDIEELEVKILRDLRDDLRLAD